VGGTLVVSRNTAIFSWMQGAFEENGFRNITLTSLDKKEIASQLIELKPKIIFLDSTFYRRKTWRNCLTFLSEYLFLTNQNFLSP
jgi:hypothetical protein